MDNDYKSPEKNMGKRISVLELVNVGILIIFTVAALYPFYNVYIYAFNDGFDSLKGPLYLWPRVLTFENFLIAFREEGIVNAFKITLLRTIIGTLGFLLCTSSLAYAMTKREVPGFKLFSYYFFITFMFGGGLIPYFLVLKQIGLYDNFWVLIVPSLYSYWNMIVFRSFFNTIPASIEESAKMDGASYFRIFGSLIVPLSKPVFAAVALFAAIAHWNDWFSGAFFIKNQNLIPLQTLLQKVMNEADMTERLMTIGLGRDIAQMRVTPYSIRLAIVVITVTPIVMVYPFLQKYFVKGIMIGAVKG